MGGARREYGVKDDALQWNYRPSQTRRYISNDVHWMSHGDMLVDGSGEDRHSRTEQAIVDGNA